MLDSTETNQVTKVTLILLFLKNIDLLLWAERMT